VKMKSKVQSFRQLGLVFAGVGLGCLGVAHAEEVPTGYVVTKANLNATDKQTFQGHNLGEMITPVMRKLVENGLKLKLVPTQPTPLAPKLIAASEKYSGGVKYDKATRRISGYVAGMPFPHMSLSEKDPDIAEKVIWNHFYSYPAYGDNMIPTTTAYSIDGVRGLERTFELANVQIKLKNRTSMEPLPPKAIGDGNVFRKLLIFNLAPQDVAGTGAYIQRYDDGRVDDSWAYIKAVRRVRRISGGTWMDPIPGTDLLNDDSGCLDAFPTWYPKYTFIKKQWVLGVAHGEHRIGKGGATIEAEVDIKNAPYWNVIQPWEPREVFVIDAYPPKEHPYSKRRVYYDINANAISMCDMYDKKGELWKFSQLPFTSATTMDGQPVSSVFYDWSVDFQRMHSTYIAFLYSNVNAPVDPRDWAPETLANSEKFSATGLKKRYGPSMYDPVNYPVKGSGK